MEIVYVGMKNKNWVSKKVRGLEPKYLEIEITESMTLDVESAISTLIELKKIGVMISIDDFGTGYSSLN
ncbi:MULTISPECIES: EAL domain-containing protein [Peribacillus]|uniref:EAL domain-containing protein n=1 Tax=Peribacillus frigoritolerans TaxID=450367 RepID=UPI003DA0577D